MFALRAHMRAQLSHADCWHDLFPCLRLQTALSSVTFARSFTPLGAPRQSSHLGASAHSAAAIRCTSKGSAARAHALPDLTYQLTRLVDVAERRAGALAIVVLPRVCPSKEDLWVVVVRAL